jgi:hypothetical protein
MRVLSIAAVAGAVPLNAVWSTCPAAILIFVLLVSGARAQQEAIDMHLEDVGFVMRAAAPQRFERLRLLLPAHRFVGRTINGRRYYVYSDPDLCKCIFLGDETAMQSYQGLVAAAATSNAADAANSVAATPAGKVLIEEMNDDLSRSIASGDILDY